VKPRQRDEALIAEVAAQVRRRRQELGLTLQDLAQRTGLTQGYVGSIEQGRRDVGVSSIGHLARGLGCAARDLFGPPGLIPEQRKSVEDEVAMMLHAHRDCLRNKKQDTSKIRFDCRDGYYGEALGVMRELAALGYASFGPVNVPGYLNYWMAQIEDRVLREENFGGSNECDHCLERYGKDGAGRKRT
jgi:transcriptional regulator with XRE-family HTH domain